MSASNIAPIIPLADAHRSRKTGAKAADLSRLIAARFDVPRGFVISSDAYRAHLWAAGVREVAAEAQEAEEREQVRSAILSASVPEDIQTAIEKASEQLALQLGDRRPKLAVRPCPEDTGPGSDMPGAYESYLNVSGTDALLTAVKRVWASVWSGKAAAYRARFGAATEPAMAVLVQQMIEAAHCATVCTADLVTGDPLRPVVTLSPTDGDSLRQTVDLAGPADQAGHAAVLAVERSILVEDVLEGHAEVEWADDGRRFWVLQARPIRDLPTFFPDAETDRDQRWRLAAPVPVSHFAQSLLSGAPRSAEAGNTSRRIVNGFVYRRVLTEAETKRLSGPALAERALSVWRRDAEELRESARRSLRSDPSALDGAGLRSAAADAAHGAIRAVEWLGSARTNASGLTAALRASIPDPSLFHSLLSGALAPLALRDAELQELADRFAEAEASDKVSDASWWSAYKNDVSAFARSCGFAFREEAEILDIARWRSWVEDPDPVFRLIAAMARRQNRPSLAACQSAAVEAARQAAEVTGKLRDGRRGAVKRVLAQSREWMAAAAECESVCGLTASALRRLVAEEGRRLCDFAVLGSPDDVYHLTLDEILGLPDSPPGEHRAEIRRTVAARKHRSWLSRRLKPPAELPADPAGHAETEAAGRDGVLHGTLAGPGTAAGRARTLTREADASDFSCGDILVLSGAAHAWTPLLAVAGGVVCADADDLCAAAVLARDYGIPAVVGCAGFTGRIRDGQKVTLDGDTGHVELHGR